MDLSDLISSGGGSTSTLNEALSAQTASGESVFSKPFGSSTAYRTATGALRVAFVFDPRQVYDETAILASMNPDYTEVLRESLSEELLTEAERAPRGNSEEDIVRETIKKSLPEEVLSQCYLNNKETLQAYVEMYSRHARRVYVEETTLREALTTRNFSFCFKIAIDAFPNKNVENTHVRRGVLTFHIQGGTHALAAIESMSAASAEEAAREDPHYTPAPAPTSTLAPGSGGKKDKGVSGVDKAEARARTSSFMQDMRQVHDLMSTLHMSPTSKEHVQTVVAEKKFPVLLDDFFEDVRKWLQVVVETRSQQLEDQQGRKVPMYQ